MSWGDPPQQSAHRPNTLGDTWRNMNQPRGLPTLPDWPPLPDVPDVPDVPAAAVQADVSAFGRALSDAPAADAMPARPPLPGIPGAAGVPPESPEPSARPVAVAPQERRRVFRRLRNVFKPASPSSTPSSRAKRGIAAAAVLGIVLIVAIATVALHLASPRVAPSYTSQAGSSALHAARNTGTATVVTTGTAQATTTPTPTGRSSQPLTLAFTCASGTLHGTGQVCVHTQPQAALSVSIRYCDGTTAKGLHGNSVADASGNYTWTWPVRTACAGAATATVTAKWNGQTITRADSFTIGK